jgi:hypothetical protein
MDDSANQVNGFPGWVNDSASWMEAIKHWAIQKYDNNKPSPDTAIDKTARLSAKTTQLSSSTTHSS